jgi:Fe-S-cluster-containing dehydrogenase component
MAACRPVWRHVRPGARVFGNLNDPESEIRWVLENKRVFVLKEELGLKPQFFYFFDE